MVHLMQTDKLKMLNLPNYLTILPSCPRLFRVCPQVSSPEAFVSDMFHCELAVVFLPLLSDLHPTFGSLTVSTPTLENKPTPFFE